jgi:hypothetical protein
MSRIRQLALGLSFAYLLINGITLCSQSESVDSAIDAKNFPAGQAAQEREFPLLCQFLASTRSNGDSGQRTLRWHGDL